MEIRRIASPLRVKGLDSAMHDTNEYVLMLIYISASREDGIKVLCRIFREIHLVSDLKTHLLIDNNIIDSEKIILDIAQGKIYINNCDAIATIISRQRESYQRRVIVTRKAFIIAPRADAIVSIATSKDLPIRDFIFKSLQ